MHYKLDSSAKKKVTGTFPQIELKQNVFKDGRKPDYKKLNSQSFVSEEINLNEFTLSDNAILTDVLSSNILSEKIGLVVNDKTRAILEVYNNEYTHIFPLLISDTPYFFLQVINCYNNIDFKKSYFLDELNDGAIEQVSSYDAYCKRLDDTFITAKEIHLKKELDIFRLPFDAEILISEKLKDEIIQEQISGVEIKPYTNFKITSPTSEDS